MILFLVLGAVLSGVIVAYWFAPRVRVTPVSEGPAPQVDAKDLRPTVQGLDYTQVNQGRKEWTLFSTTARFDEGSKSLNLDGVLLAFYPREGGKVTIEGNLGLYQDRRKRVVLKGDVKARTQDGIVLTTRKLVYSEKDQVVVTDDPVKITGRDFAIKATGMEVDITREVVHFNQRVRTTLVPRGSGPPPGATVEDS
jgi:LPS export ABC transporter protein LptC